MTSSASKSRLCGSGPPKKGTFGFQPNSTIHWWTMRSWLKGSKNCSLPGRPRNAGKALRRSHFRDVRPLEIGANMDCTAVLKQVGLRTFNHLIVQEQLEFKTLRNRTR